jgi:hypothetical protein
MFCLFCSSHLQNGQQSSRSAPWQQLILAHSKLAVSEPPASPSSKMALLASPPPCRRVACAPIKGATTCLRGRIEFAHQTWRSSRRIQQLKEKRIIAITKWMMVRPSKRIASEAKANKRSRNKETTKPPEHVEESPSFYAEPRHCHLPLPLSSRHRLHYCCRSCDDKWWTSETAWPADLMGRDGGQNLWASRSEAAW